MTKHRTDWIVLDSNKQEARCNRCGATEPLEPYNGQLLEAFMGFLNVFERAHRNCKEKKVTPKIGQIWKEVDPRMERFVIITAVNNQYANILTCTHIGTVFLGTRVTRCKVERFNGKRGGYSYVKDKE